MCLDMGVVVNVPPVALLVFRRAECYINALMCLKTAFQTALFTACAFALFFFSGCSSSPKHVLVVGMDGGDWNLLRQGVKQGDLPTLASFFKEGAAGRLEADAPFGAEMNWASLWTGELPDKHGVFDEESDEFRHAPPLGPPPSLDAALWSQLREKGKKVLLIGTPVLDRSAGPPYFGSFHWDSRHYFMALPGKEPPPSLPAGRAEAVLKIQNFPNEETAAMSREALSAAEAIGTSARSVLSKGDWDAAFVFFPGLDTLSHLWTPYMAPRMPRVTAREEGLYHDVVRQAYRHYDKVLADLLKKIPPDTTVWVFSAYGVRSGFERPFENSERFMAGLTTREHASDGFVLAKGQGIAHRRLRGARVYDAAPTLAAVEGFRLQAKADGKSKLPGKVLAAAFTHPVYGGKDMALPAQAPKMPQGDARLLAQGRYFLMHKRYDEAFSLFKGLSEKYPEEPLPPYYRGEGAYGKKNYKNALEWYTRSAEAWGNFVPAYIGAAKSYRRLAKIDRSEKTLSKVAQVFHEPLLYNTLGDFAADNVPGLAENYYTYSIHLCPVQVYPYVRRAEVRAADGYPYKAIDELRNDPLMAGQTFVYLSIGKIYEQEADYENMERAGKDAVSAAPDDARAYLLLGRAQAARGDKEKARKNFETAADYASRSPEPVYRLALLQYDAGKRSEAIRSLRKLTTRFPDYTPVWVSYGAWLQKSGQKKEAVKALKRALSLDPLNGEARRLLEPSEPSP